MENIIPLTLAAAALAVVGFGAALAGGGLAAASSTKATYTYRAAMAPGGEVPRPKGAAGAKGTFTATVIDVGATRTLKWKLTFSGLSGKAAASHIHKGKAGVSGGVLVPLCGPCRSGQTGTLKISSGAADALERGLTYVNAHTERNPGGEIRGQVKLVGHVDDSGATSPTGSSGSTGSTGTTGDDSPPPGY